METTKVESRAIPIDTNAAVAIHLDGPGRGEIVGRIVLDTGPTEGDQRNCFRDFPWHALDDTGVVASCESYGGALRELLSKWVNRRMALEARG